MSSATPILSSLGEIAPDYDALICDVWGVVHDGERADQKACDSLTTFRERFGPVVLVSNAPRPEGQVRAQLQNLGVPDRCHDAIVTAGAAARADLAARADGALRLFHLGPERDVGVYEGLPVERSGPDEADVVLCTGLFDDTSEAPDDYEQLLKRFRARSIVMLCANPDRVVQRGGKLFWCAGALAHPYEEMGGRVVWFGKPYPAIYQVARTAIGEPKRPLAIGDGLATDIKGANDQGIDALFIGEGIHSESLGPFTPAHVAELLREANVSARAAMRTLVW